jgi:phytoene synthase
VTVLEPRVAEAYERCREITRSEARNFYYGFVFLPPPRRAGIYAAYAFSRRCDDSVDGDDPLDCKLAALAARRAELDACYRDDPIGEDPVLIALAGGSRSRGRTWSTCWRASSGTSPSAATRTSRRSRPTAIGSRVRWGW